MAWQDYMSENEKSEYLALKNAKDKTDLAFRAASRKYKIRCDARIRRDPKRVDAKLRSNEALE